MEYQDIKNLINSILSGKESGHEITPFEHQDIIMAVLDYAHNIEITRQGVLEGLAVSNTVPNVPEDSKVCYVSLCASNQTTTFNSFSDYEGNPISVVCSSTEVKFVILFWNGKYWEKIEQSLSI